jgi:hypothetical protein
MKGHPMKRFLDTKMAALSAVVLSGAALAAAPARAFDDVVTVQGQTFWTGNPGTPIREAFLTAANIGSTPIII